MSTTTAAAPQLDPALYESRAWVPIAVVAPSLTIATACVALRVYTRAVMYGFGYDDGAAVLAMVLALACGIVVAASPCQRARVSYFSATELHVQIPSTDMADIFKWWTHRCSRSTFV